MIIRVNSEMIQGFYDGDISMGSWPGSAPVPGSMTCAAAAAAKATKATTTELFDPDNASSSMAFSVEAAPDSASSISSYSSSPSSSSSPSDDGDHHSSFFFTSQQLQSPSASSLCFGAGGPAGWLLRRSRGARARSPGRKPQEAAAAAAKVDVVGWYLRLRKARTPGNKGSPPPGQAADDTARERAESVARAVAYCKETLRRAAPPPPPSLDDLLLHDRQEEIIAGAAAYCNERTDYHSPPPRPRRAGWLSEMPAMEKQAKVSTRQPSPNGDSSVITVSHVAHGHGAMNKCRGESVMAEEAAMSSAPSDMETDELEIRTGSFDEMEFLKFFDGDKEMIALHFITIHI